jgi:hypothetical protein
MSQSQGQSSSRSLDRAAGARPIAAHFTPIYLILLAFSGIAEAVMKLRRWNDWTAGDWLINYSGGFVRRGLPGELFLLAARALQVPAAYFVWVFELACLGVLLFALYRLLRGSSLNLWVLALLLSPAGLFLQVVDPITSFHKEILLFAILSALLLLLERGAGRMALIVYLTLTCAVCVLSHEGLVFYLPYLGVALAIRYQSVRDPLQVLALPALVAAALTVAVSRFPGDGATAMRICASLGYHSVAVQDGCPDSITYLRYSPTYAHDVVLFSIESGHYLRFFALTGCLALIPVVLAVRTLRASPSARFSLTALGWGAAVCAAGSTILFVYGTDWDRWIYIHMVCVTLLLLYIDFRRLPRPEPVQSFLRPQRLILSALLLLYCTSWTPAPFDSKVPLWGVAHFVKIFARTPFHPLPLPPR